MRRLRGLRDLIHDAIDEITGLVQDTQEASVKRPVEMLAKLPKLDDSVLVADGVRRATAGSVFTTIRTINRGVQELGNVVATLVEKAGGERLVGQAEELLPPELRSTLGTLANGAQGALNAVVGDFLQARDNGLAIELGFYHDGARVEPEREALTAALGTVRDKLTVFVHGLGCTETVFQPGVSAAAQGLQCDYAQLLREQHDFTALHVRYNTGLHVSQNGRALAQQLQRLVDAWPGPLTQLVLVGHSMGGLVCRSAAHYAEADGMSALGKLSHVLCIGSPHHGAPLERAGNALASLLGLFDVAGTQVPAKILNARSAGIKDLRFGYVLDEEWTGQDPDAFLKDGRRDVPLAAGVMYGFIAATWLIGGKNPLGAWVGDMLVGVESASGGSVSQARHIPFQLGHVLHGIHHQALLTHPQVYEQLVRFIQSAFPAQVAPPALPAPQDS